MIPTSAVSHVRWPALPNATGASLLALQHQLAETERIPRREIERRQLDALGRLLAHAGATVPYYRDSGAYDGATTPLTPDTWRDVPLLTRPAAQEARERLRSGRLPRGHEPAAEVVTTGSTGRPVRALTTNVTVLIWLAITLRESLWHRRDLSGKLAAMRADPAGAIPAAGRVLPHWDARLATAYPTGPCALLSVTEDVKAQAAWLVDQDPDYVLTLPSNLGAVADHFLANGMKLGRLRQVLSYGEVLTAETRLACREAWGVEVVDMYSSQEVGYIALQCPESESYHVQSEAVYVEVLDQAGRPCTPGETGRVVVTPLHNFATPLIRYDLGDFAEVGDSCPCARTLPTLARVAGRRRNMWARPTGERFWPMFTSRKWGHLDAIRQLQLVQHSLDHVEARIVGPRPLTEVEEREFTTLLHRELAFPFRHTITYLDRIDRTRSLKFEDFVSLVEAS